MILPSGFGSPTLWVIMATVPVRSGRQFVPPTSKPSSTEPFWGRGSFIFCI